ncbi:hypothetical protein H490_0115130 [Leucobacter sp. UCD-THU]|uniref:permease prefix domain 1-containing protein n=1 Tax=Leucobacter sp. UCD-THU TaxID=1292023 RepID=UPI00036EFFB8|nr:permease prefix domain 1-containing protein [Leucobacter sp. UCD-THU]EYT51658.1 hypothetical protein H490_0115130 [Leucobacter sp. UCD-THU]
MNVIIAYLDTMFSAYPQTPRMLEAKTELQTMMEDAYASLIAEGRTENEAVGQVIRDFGNLEEVAPVLGIAAEIAPAASTAPHTGAGSAAPVAVAASSAPAAQPQHPPVTMEEARGFAEAQHRIRFRVSTAVVLFVLSPAALISLPTAADSGALPIDPGAATAIGLLALLLLVTAGVLLIVSTARDLAPYKRVSDGRFTPDAGVSHWADALAQQHERTRIRALQVAVALWILSPAPLLAFVLLMQESPNSGLWSVGGVVLVLAFVAAGLAILLPAAWAHTVAERLTGGAAAAADDDGEHSVIGVIAAFYWPLLTAIYLAWSFIGNAWGTSWVVWPIGAVLFGAIAAGGAALESYRRSRR